MGSAARFAIVLFAVATSALALAPTLAPAWADGAAVTADTEARVCLNQKERHAETESGGLVRLAVAIRAAKTRMPGTVVRALLCRGPEGLVYVLTVLAHDGKVARIEVDAVKGTLIGGL